VKEAAPFKTDQYSQYVNNYTFISDRFDGPFEDESLQQFSLPDGNFGYIAKVMPDAEGNDVMLMTVGASLSRPYPVRYDEEGRLVIGMPR
jgi:hypothetical protein